MPPPSPPSPPPPPPSWVILGSVARVSAREDADLSLALAPPPRASLLTIPPRLFPDAPTVHNFPAVLAADPSGLLLLHANQGRATGPLVIDRPGQRQFGWREFVDGYFVLDAATGSAFAIPEPELVTEKTFLGILTHPGGGGRYVVAELQPIIGCDYAELLCFASDVGEWVEKKVPDTLPRRWWVPAAVIAHHGRLWWADLSFGLITCDPFADAPALAFVPLPPGKALRYNEAAWVLHRYRVVGLSARKLRFVDMYRNRDRGGALQISEHLFGVDLRARSVVECEVYELVAPERDVVATRFVHAWELPRALSSSSGAMDQTEEKLSPASPPSVLKNKG
ncbi:unnamed protein product [Urochloa decumbens]|uniref:DUF1618 domain-containing protein n=1 Tax=Urochloa decumbens TaxID=240449 RepID=A0ABC8XR80_9POAL